MSLPVADTAALLDHPVVVRGVRRGMAPPEAPTAWQLSAFYGRLAEVSGSHAYAALTLVFRLALEAQKRGEPVAWISRKGSTFFPPDAADAGIDLRALAVVQVPDTRRAARVADHLLRSGAFGMVVLDIGTDVHLPVAAQVRLSGLAKKHGSALLCITEKDSDRPSLGSLVSLRAEAFRKQQVGEGYHCEARILKDKRRGPGWMHREVCRGPDGLC